MNKQIVITNTIENNTSAAYELALTAIGGIALLIAAALVIIL